MASTKIKSKKTDESSMPTHLSSSDLLKCETMSRDIRTASLEMNLEEQALRNIALEYKLMEHKIEKQKEAVLKKRNELHLCKQKYNQYMTEMWPRYGISYQEGKLGYDDESGEIKQTI
jgi:hypothetical protein